MRVAIASMFLLACSSTSPSQNDASVEDASSTDSSTSNDASANDASTNDAADASANDASLPGWTLVWSDEFNGANGSAPDPTIWTHEVGGQGWGNDELEYYTDGTENSVIENGNLVVTAQTTGASKYQCANDGAGGACQYTSARINTLATKTATGFSQTYGRFEARIQAPIGKGLWPAFWMLGTNIDQVDWPACGEVDTMEILGSDTTTTYGHLHMSQSGGNYGPGTSFKLSTGAFSDDFHVFAIEWQQGEVDFFVDQTKYETIDSSTTPANATWAFDGHPFYILLNMAVGSKDSWPGAPDQTTVFPAKMLVDYVRVYTKAQ